MGFYLVLLGFNELTGFSYVFFQYVTGFYRVSPVRALASPVVRLGTGEKLGKEKPSKALHPTREYSVCTVKCV